MQSADDRRARRAAMVFGKANTFAEHEEQGIEFWRRASMAERFQAAKRPSGCRAPRKIRAVRSVTARTAHAILPRPKACPSPFCPSVLL